MRRRFPCLVLVLQPASSDSPAREGTLQRSSRGARENMRRARMGRLRAGSCRQKAPQASTNGAHADDTQRLARKLHAERAPQPALRKRLQLLRHAARQHQNHQQRCLRNARRVDACAAPHLSQHVVFELSPGPGEVTAGRSGPWAGEGSRAPAPTGRGAHWYAARLRSLNPNVVVTCCRLHDELELVCGVDGICAAWRRGGNQHVAVGNLRPAEPRQRCTVLYLGELPGTPLAASCQLQGPQEVRAHCTDAREKAQGTFNSPHTCSAKGRSAQARLRVTQGGSACSSLRKRGWWPHSVSLQVQRRSLQASEAQTSTPVVQQVPAAWRHAEQDFPWLHCVQTSVIGVKERVTLLVTSFCVVNSHTGCTLQRTMSMSHGSANFPATTRAKNTHERYLSFNARVASELLQHLDWHLPIDQHRA